MKEQQVLKSIAEHFSRQPFGQLMIFLIILLVVLVVGVFIWALLQNSRQKRDLDILSFVVERHRLKEYEVEILLSVAARRSIRPLFLIMMDPVLFQEHVQAIEDSLADRLQFRPQAVRARMDLENRLFKG